MSVVNVLPNGYLIVTLSPREAIMTLDNLLEPEGYPWQTTESQIVTMELKSHLKAAIEGVQYATNEMLKQALPRPGDASDDDGPDYQTGAGPVG